MNTEKRLVTLARRKNPAGPCLVIGHADDAYAASCGRHLGKLGWEVHITASGQEARRLARVLSPNVVVLDADLPGESGWLTCKKIRHEHPSVKVVLVGPRVTRQLRDFAAFVGAAGLVSKAAGGQALVNEVKGAALPAAG